MNVYDGIPFPFGFGVNRSDYKQEDLTEPKELVRKLMKSGLSILSVSIGNPYYNPHLGRPFNAPVKGTSTPEEHPLTGVDRLIRLTGEMQKEFPKLPVVGAGYSWLKHYFPNVAAGVIGSGLATLVGQGRGALAYPDSVKDLLEYGVIDPDKACISCSGCTQKMRKGQPAGCIVRDRKVYG